MNKRFFLYFVVLTVFLFACGNKQERQNNKFKKAIASYMGKNMEAFNIDSISILGVDSLTDFDFAYFQQVIFKNYEMEIIGNPKLYIYPDTDKEFDEKEKLQAQLQMIQNRINSCDSIMLDSQTDTTSIQYFFVATKIFGKDNKGELKTHEIGFPINKNFEIKEINFFD